MRNIPNINGINANIFSFLNTYAVNNNNELKNTNTKLKDIAINQLEDMSIVITLTLLF